ncbi:hypothetical protein LPB136_06105 [Tenacibaculum todarodis]|uniref:Uncharacterized protein n=1 Tax=Tenacibaculum todarodis TaxID=1850252 RepID=A0A1L3JIJ0_9FLAO|nr:hypothetical protein [Tenacibaculum todarodis]APG64955.1 hypothetical protein LPB136_06105 [Tenacibaculum todarodis]
MNRLNFLKNISLGAASVLFFPYSTYSNNENFSFGFQQLEGMDLISSLGEKYSLEKLESNGGIIEKLNTLNFSINNSNFIRFNKSCFIKPIKKSLLFSSETNLLIVIKNNGRLKHYVLNEEFSKQYSDFILNYTHLIKDKNIDKNSVLNFVPTEVIENSKDQFSFKTTNNSIVKIKKTKGRLNTYIYSS